MDTMSIKGWRGWWAPLAALSLLAGCASTPMALNPDQSNLKLEGESVVLFRLETANAYKPKYQPRVLGLHVVNLDSGEELSFDLGDQMKGGLAGGFEYWVSLRLPAGYYEITSATGISTGYNIMAHFEIPLHERVDAADGKVMYLGRFEAVNVARIAADEIPSGGKLPLIPQAVAGYADGTFQVSITDRFSTDMSLFKARYPALVGMKTEDWGRGVVSGELLDALAMR